MEKQYIESDIEKQVVHEKQYIRADIEKQIVHCRECKKSIIRHDLRQIVYFCSKKCRKEWRSK